MGRTGTNICLVVVLLNYLMTRGMAPGPLFLFRDGAYRTHQSFVKAVRQTLKTAGVDQSHYCGHSFQIGAATTAVAREVEDSVIKTLGRWSSTAYLQYVRIPKAQLRNFLFQNIWSKGSVRRCR